MSKKRKGFTLTELVVVIVIIGVLAAVLIPTLTSYIKKARYSNDVALVTNINKILVLEEILEESPNDAVELELLLEDRGLKLETQSEGNYLFYSKETGRAVLGSLGEEGIEIKAGASAASYTGKYLSEILSLEEFIDGYLFITTKSKDGFADAITGLRNGDVEQVNNLDKCEVPYLVNVITRFAEESVFVTDDGATTIVDGAKKHVIIAKNVDTLDISNEVLPDYTPLTLNILDDFNLKGEGIENYCVKLKNEDDIAEFGEYVHLNTYSDDDFFNSLWVNGYALWRLGCDASTKKFSLQTSDYIQLINGELYIEGKIPLNDVFKDENKIVSLEDIPESISGQSTFTTNINNYASGNYTPKSWFEAQLSEGYLYMYEYNDNSLKFVNNSNGSYFKTWAYASASYKPVASYVVNPESTEMFTYIYNGYFYVMANRNKYYIDHVVDSANEVNGEMKNSRKEYLYEVDNPGYYFMKLSSNLTDYLDDVVFLNGDSSRLNSRSYAKNSDGSKHAAGYVVKITNPNIIISGTEQFELRDDDYYWVTDEDWKDENNYRYFYIKDGYTFNKNILVDGTIEFEYAGENGDYQYLLAKQPDSSRFANLDYNNSTCYYFYTTQVGYTINTNNPRKIVSDCFVADEEGNLSFEKLDVYKENHYDLEIIDIPSNIVHLTSQSLAYLAGISNHAVITYKNEALYQEIEELAATNSDAETLINSGNFVKTTDRSSKIVTVVLEDYDSLGNSLSNSFKRQVPVTVDGNNKIINLSGFSNHFGHTMGEEIKTWEFTNYEYNSELGNEFIVNDNTVSIKRIWTENDDATKVAIYNNQYYKFDDLIDQMNERYLIGGTITILGNDNIVDRSLTIPKNITIILPANNDSLENGYMLSTNNTSTGRIFNPDEGTPYTTLTILSNKLVHNYGTIVVGAKIGTSFEGDNGAMSSYVYNDYAQLIVNGGIDSYGDIKAYGFITGEGSIIENKGEVTSLLCLEDWHGGTNALACIRNGVSPFNNWSLNNIRIPVSYTKNSTLTAFAASNSIGTISIELFGFGGRSLFESARGNVIVKYNENRQGLDIIVSGDVKDNSVSVELLGMNFDLTTISFPISNMRIDVASGITEGITIPSSLTLTNCKYKILPGSSINIDASSTLNIGSDFAVYDSFVHTGAKASDCAVYPYPQSASVYNSNSLYQERDAARLNIKGSLNITGNHKFSGYITLSEGAKLYIDANVELETAFKEGFGTQSDQLYTPVFNAHDLVTRYTFIDVYNATYEAVEKVLLTRNSSLLDEVNCDSQILNFNTLNITYTKAENNTGYELAE